MGGGLGLCVFHKAHYENKTLAHKAEEKIAL
jgi:hypothetical protein